MVHDRFDHTSQGNWSARFSAGLNLTPWRASVTGDMTSAFNFAAPPDPMPLQSGPPGPSIAEGVRPMWLGF